MVATDAIDAYILVLQSSIEGLEYKLNFINSVSDSKYGPLRYLAFVVGKNK